MFTENKQKLEPIFYSVEITSPSLFIFITYYIYIFVVHRALI